MALWRRSLTATRSVVVGERRVRTWLSWLIRPRRTNEVPRRCKLLKPPIFFIVIKFGEGCYRFS